MTDVNTDELNNRSTESGGENSDVAKNDSNGSNAERMVPLSALQEERKKRQELEAKLEANTPKPSTDDPDLELIADRLTPVLQKRFISREEKEDEDRAQEYARTLESLSKKYDGKDGRPAFDPVEVADHAKRTNNFNLEAAYKDMHWKELVDFEIKNASSSDHIETEGSAASSKSGEPTRLTAETIAEKLAGPDGLKWYEENREKILTEMQKGGTF